MPIVRPENRSWPKTALATIGLVVIGLSGCTESSTADDPQLMDPAAHEAPEPIAPTLQDVTYDVRFDGRLGRGYLVTAGDAGDGRTLSSEERFFEFEQGGPVQWANLTMTWSPTSPVTQTLRLGFGYECQDEQCADWDYAQGTSPLSSSGNASGREPTVFVYVPNSSAVDGIGLYLRDDQPFAIEGTVTITQRTDAN